MLPELLKTALNGQLITMHFTMILSALLSHTVFPGIEVWQDAKFMHFLDYYANVMAKDFQQYLVDLGYLIFAFKIATKFLFQHTKDRFAIAPLMVMRHEVLILGHEPVDHSIPCGSSQS